MNTKKVMTLASNHLATLVGHSLHVLEVAKPVSHEAAVNLAKIVSKLSPLVGNLIEFNICEFLNAKDEFSSFGTWKRQDPGFPDTVFVGSVKPTPGFEVKAWLPLATEITARFKDSQTAFAQGNTDVAILAWLPEHVIFGEPKILDIVIVSGASVAKARDDHYHNPPDYLVMEPEDTSSRTANLQQTNTGGHKFQGSASDLQKAAAIVRSWGPSGETYSTSPDYQAKLKALRSRFDYRVDTNFAKMDRIDHAGIEAFKQKVYQTKFHGRTVGDWNTLLSSANDAKIKAELAKSFKIGSDGTDLIG